MPNWCKNQLIVHGDAASVLAAIAGTETAFDFNKIVPMPPELHVESGTRADVAIVCARENGLGEFADFEFVKQTGIMTTEELCQHYGFAYDEMLTFGKRLLSNIDRFGHPSWYDWRWENWGTKWNACDTEIVEVHGRIGVRFSTAWEPPVPIVVALGKRFPTQHFSLGWMEPMTERAGLYRVHGEQTICKPLTMSLSDLDGEPLDCNRPLEHDTVLVLNPLEDLDSLSVLWNGPCECDICKDSDVKQHRLD